MRRLLIVPIIHSQTDLGSLTGYVNAAKDNALGPERASGVRRGIDQFWIDVQTVFQSLQLIYANLLIYQDGLPKVENPALQIEQQIVNELAKNGSPNHRLVKWLVEQGAGLVGTESPELLLKEYEAIRRSLASGFNSSDVDKTKDTTEPSLIEQRDRFIAQRIADTLGDQQVGVLFIGMMHRVEDHLIDDIEIEYPVGRPTFKLMTTVN